MKTKSILQILLMSTAILISSCEQSTAIQTDFDPITPPPQASTLREIARIRPKAPQIRQPTLTQDGVYYADTDGIFKISISGESKLFTAWDQIPEFWKSWQETRKSYDSSPSLPPIYPMTDGSIIVGNLEQLPGDNGTGSLLTFQHISKDGVPLKQIQSLVSGFLSRGNTFIGLDEARGLLQVHGLYIGEELSAILDFSRGTFQRLEKVSPSLRNPSEFRVIGKRIFSFTRDHALDDKGEPWIVAFNFDGKVVEKESLASLLGMSWNQKTDGFSGFVVSGGKVGIWISQSQEDTDPHQETCTVYLINPAQLSRSNVSSVYQEKTNTPGACNSERTIWLGGRYFAKRTESGVELGTLSRQAFTIADNWLWDWRFDWRRVDRTQDGSLTVYEIPNYKIGQSRLLLINPDGRLRLAHTFVVDADLEHNFVPDFLIDGSYVLIFSNGKEILYNKIEDTAN